MQITLMRKSIKSGKTELEYLGEKFGKVNIKQGIFHGNSISTSFCKCFDCTINLNKENGFMLQVSAKQKNKLCHI